MTKPKSLWKKLTKRIVLSQCVKRLLNGLRQHLTFRSQFWLKKIAPKFMKPSEMLLRVLYAPPTNIACKTILMNAEIDDKLNVYGCTATRTPEFGNLAKGEFIAIYNSFRARIIKLSVLNRSYCFCHLRKCNDLCYAPITHINSAMLKTPLLPTTLSIDFDPTCNLRCTMCRKSHYAADENTKKTLNQLVDKLQSADWLRQIPHLFMAGSGEVFYSDIYGRLLRNISCKKITILSNGTLFDKTAWNKIENHYEEVEVMISVDAASSVTYQKIRGGNFDQLMKNLVMLGELRQQGAIKYFRLNFVVQKDNYLEMVDFVKLAKSIHADNVFFQRLNNWGTFTRREYKQKSLLLKNRYLTRELYEILQDPIFKDPIVDLTAFQPYIAASAKRYNERSEISDM